MELMIREDIEEKVIGCLLNRPSNLLGADINIQITDFTNRLNRIFFGVIDHLARNGMATITTTDVSNFLKNYPGQYEYYVECRGENIIDKCIYDTNLESFSYYYKTLKKVALINNFIQKGFNVSKFHNPEETDIIKKRRISNDFENASVEDILAEYSEVINEARKNFSTEITKVSLQAGEGLDSLVKRLMEVPEIGMSTSSTKLNTIFRGRRLKKLYMYSSIQGGGKSRLAMGDAGKLATKKTYNWDTNKWEINKNVCSTLYITTEMEPEEVQTMLLAYVSGINEEKILNGDYTEEEFKIVNEAVEVIKDSPIYFDYMSTFNVEDIEEAIKIHKQQHNIKVLFFDYLHLNMKISSSVTSKMGLSNNREDLVLLMFADRLKGMANDYNIHIHTSTQLNGDWEKKENPNQNLLRGSKAIADKVDAGVIILPITQQDGLVIQELQQKYEIQPNLVMHIYKNRGNKLKNIKVFINFDYGTCRVTDCFVTDQANKEIFIEDTIIQ